MERENAGDEKAHQEEPGSQPAEPGGKCVCNSENRRLEAKKIGLLNKIWFSGSRIRLSADTV
jgi:hypothetical protein